NFQKIIFFFRDAQRVARKLCILSKNFIEQKSFRIKKYLLGTLKIAKKAILKNFDFLRDATHVTQKLCILSKKFIEQKSFKIKNYPLGDLRIAKFPKFEFFFSVNRT
ncbi:MAG: hypothetical protein AAFU33_28585, partial [Bacteroidota bacterium]